MSRQTLARRAISVGDVPTAVLLLVEQLAIDQGMRSGPTSAVIQHDRELRERGE